MEGMRGGVGERVRERKGEKMRARQSGMEREREREREKESTRPGTHTKASLGLGGCRGCRGSGTNFEDGVAKSIERERTD
jgi:hypothetical protein